MSVRPESNCFLRLINVGWTDRATRWCFERPIFRVSKINPRKVGLAITVDDIGTQVLDIKNEHFSVLHQKSEITLLGQHWLILWRQLTSIEWFQSHRIKSWQWCFSTVVTWWVYEATESVKPYVGLFVRNVHALRSSNQSNPYVGHLGFAPLPCEVDLV